MTEAIQQERFETQNIIIVRYFQISRLDHLYHAAEHEEKEDRRAEIEGRANGALGDGNSQLALEAPPDHSQNSSLTKFTGFSLGQLDHHFNQIRQSPKERLQAANR